MSEKTEPPSEKRIRDAREKGQFLFSREIVAGALLIAITLVLFLTAPMILARLQAMLDGALDHVGEPLEASLPRLLGLIFSFAATTLGAVYGAAILTAIIANVAQTGPVFSPAKLSKGLQALNFISNAKQMASGRNLFNFFMNLVKLLLIGYVAYLVFRGFIGEFFGAVQCGFACMLWTGGRAMGVLFGVLGAVYIPVAVVDFILQRYFYLKELRMTKDEVKREYKEMEGSPEIKSYRRQAHQELLNSSMLNSVRRASVVIKNPDHYAIALLYDEEETPLPVVLGKGSGGLAREMVKLAEREGIPVYEDAGLARDLYADVELGHYITRDFLAPVAEVLRYIEALKERR